MRRTRLDMSKLVRVSEPFGGHEMTHFRREVIGDATLILGDCRELLETVGPVDAVVTDPPYGIRESNQKNMTRGTSTARVARKTVTDYGDFEWDDKPIDDV